MRVIVPEEEESYLIQHIVHYGRIKRWAYKKSLEIPHGSSVIDLEVYHVLYLQNLFALLDEFFDSKEKKENGKDGKYNYWGNEKISYAKELRNYLIHRGGKNNAGESDGNIISSILPESVSDRSAKIIYTRSFKYYHDLFKYLENELNPKILEEALKFLKERNCSVTFDRKKFNDDLDKVDHMPDWAKDMSKNIPDCEMQKIFSQLFQNQEMVLKELFGQCDVR